MKYLFLLCCLGLVALGRPARAARPFTAPPDTIAGETHLTRLLTQGICEQIAMQSRHQDLTVLTKAQGLGLLNEVLIAVIIRDSAAFRSLLANTADTTAVMQRISMRAVLNLSGACPTANKLLLQMGVQMAGLDTNLTPGQEQVLQTVAHDLCGKLTAADAQQAFGQRTAPERIAAFRAARHQIILIHGQALVAAFGEQLLDNAQLESTMWQNVDRLMFEICPALTGQLRLDLGLAQMQAAAPPAKVIAPPKARPGRKK